MSALRRVGVLGDVHAEDQFVEIALERFAAVGVDRVLCVGDIVDGSGSVSRCCALLATAEALVVRGNHERWFLKNALRDLPNATQPADVDPSALAFLASLPASCVLPTIAGPLLLCHGLGDDDMNRLLPDDFGYALSANDALRALIESRDVAFVINGHTHRRMVRKFEPLTVINAGTLARDHEPGFVVVDFEARHAEFYDLATDEVALSETVAF
ncbi:MAG TPA: metallophosphoesterase family protein [Labilithrix sp.]|nr:metallophosphoesterase family protein [Labilithrix sp.]